MDPSEYAQNVADSQSLIVELRTSRVTFRNVGITIDTAHGGMPPTMGSVKWNLSSHSTLALGEPFFYLLLQSARAVDTLDLGV
jgi:hypothetical protein